MRRGRPTEYKEEYERQAYIACKEGGFTDLKLAQLFGVSRATITNWKRERPDFLATIKKGKDEFNVAKAEECLLKRISGYSYTEIHKEKNPLTGEIETVKTVKKHIPSDTTANIFFLKNRDPKRWRDKLDLGIDNTAHIPNITDDMTEADTMEIYRNVLG